MIAISKYDKVAKVVAPKKAALAVAEQQFNTAMASLEVKRQQLREAREKVISIVKCQERKLLMFQSFRWLNWKNV